MHPFLIALQFLTRLPIRTQGEWQEQKIASSVLYYPLVGALIGALLWFVGNLFNSFSPVLAAAVLLLLWVLISGGLHLDGLADSADAWAGGYGDKQRSLDIMQDPAAGPFAVVVLVLLLLLKFSALSVIIESKQFYLLMVAPVLGRLSVIVLFLTTPYVRKNGLGDAMAKYFNRRHAYVVTALTVLSSLLVFPSMAFMLAMALSFIALYVLRYLMLQRLDGMTGDTIGASLEITETVALFSLALVFS